MARANDDRVAQTLQRDDRMTPHKPGATEYEDATMLVVCHGGVIHSVEETFGQVEGRVPNLGGRVVNANKTDWSLGDRLVLVKQTTGGSLGDMNNDRL